MFPPCTSNDGLSQVEPDWSAVRTTSSLNSIQLLIDTLACQPSDHHSVIPIAGSLVHGAIRSPIQGQTTEAHLRNAREPFAEDDGRPHWIIMMMDEKAGRTILTPLDENGLWIMVELGHRRDWQDLCVRY